MIKKISLFLACSAIGFATPTLIVDPHFSPYMGAYDLLFTHWALRSTEDYFRPECNNSSTATVAGRTMEQLFLWNTINYTASVTQHEFFGHGYRLRELGVSPKKYLITPWSGATYFHLKDSFPVGNLLAVVVAGLEAEAILAQKTKMDWIQQRQLDGRLSTLYFQAQQSLFFYTLITQKGRVIDNSVSSGNDIEAYLGLMNASYDHSTDLGTLLKWSAFNWLDPMTFYALYGWFYYIAEGTPWKFPMIKLKEGVYYLPNARIGFAPYGPEAYVENFFSIHENPLYFYLKGGKRSAGLGISYDYVLTDRKGSLGVCFDGWRQNQFVTSSTIGELDEGLSVANPALNNKIWGIAASLTGRWNFHKSFALFAELGGKTKGYLPGYQLDGGLVARVGLSLINNKDEK